MFLAHSYTCSYAYTDFSSVMTIFIQITDTILSLISDHERHSKTREMASSGDGSQFNTRKTLFRPFIVVLRYNVVTCYRAMFMRFQMPSLLKCLVY